MMRRKVKSFLEPLRLIRPSSHSPIVFLVIVAAILICVYAGARWAEKNLLRDAKEMLDFRSRVTQFDEGLP